MSMKFLILDFGATNLHTPSPVTSLAQVTTFHEEHERSYILSRAVSVGASHQQAKKLDLEHAE